MKQNLWTIIKIFLDQINEIKQNELIMKLKILLNPKI